MAEPFYEAIFIQPGSSGVSVALENAHHFAPGGQLEGRTLEIEPYAADLIVSMTARATDGEMVPLSIPDIQPHIDGTLSGPTGSDVGQEIAKGYINKRLAEHTPTSHQRLACLLFSWKGLKLLKGSGIITTSNVDKLTKARMHNKIDYHIRSAGYYLLSFPEPK
jgi:hypothetical protein